MNHGLIEHGRAEKCHFKMQESNLIPPDVVSLAMRYLLGLSLLFILACASSSHPYVRTISLGEVKSDTGSITLVFSHRAPNVVIAIGGKLLVDGGSVHRLRIDGVDSGVVDIAIAGGGVERSLRVWVDSGKNTSVPVAGPPSQASTMNPFLSAGLSIVALIITRAATTWLFLAKAASTLWIDQNRSDRCTSVCHWGPGWYLRSLG